MDSILQSADLFVTGGAGTLGRAIARRRHRDRWSGKLTVYSTDDHKHDVMRRMFPDSGINYVQGDIRNPDTLYNAMVGHDVVIHAAAVKVIPVSEFHSIDTIDVNIGGSQVVCATALRAGIKIVLGISTDKACHPANLYGATKMAMEKIFQEYARTNDDTRFQLVRYGNVLESTGSVIEMWRKAQADGYPIRITDPEMTRFWLSPSQAVDYVISSINEFFDTGDIYVPLMPALSIGKLAKLVVGDEYQMQRVPIRPGEKKHETLITIEELGRTLRMSDRDALVVPSTDEPIETIDPVNFLDHPYSSDIAPEMSETELATLLADA